MRATLDELHALLPGARRVGDPAVAIERVHSDTRSLLPGDLFVALKGEHFDAHRFLADARARGAVAALRPVAQARGGRLWCVFGCGGNRDAAKRPLMGAIACRLADHVVVTSDNPRGEPPDFIISQILAGVVGHDEIDVIEKRADAVRHAIVDAGPADVVLLAGKGHESYQEIAGVRHSYSDLTQAEAALRLREPRS